MISDLEMLRDTVTMCCVAKSCAVRDSNKDKIGTITFRQKVQVIVDAEEDENTFSVIVTERPVKKGEKGMSYMGHVPRIALTTETIRDFSCLLYRNAMGKPIPVFRRYGSHEAVGRIPVGVDVKLIALVGDYALTSSGWTMFKWLEKNRDIISIDAARDLVAAMVYQSVNDYTKIVHRLQGLKWKTPEEFLELANEMETIREWFGDNKSGSGNLAALDRHLEVGEEWVKSVFRKRNRMLKKGLKANDTP